MGTLLREHGSHRLRPTDEIGMPVHVHYVVQVAWAASLAEGAQLLAEQLNQRVADHTVSGQRPIAMTYGINAIGNERPVLRLPGELLDLS